MRILALASAVACSCCKIVTRPFIIWAACFMRVPTLLSFVALSSCKCETRSPFRWFKGLRRACVAVLAIIAARTNAALEVPAWLIKSSHGRRLVRETARSYFMKKRETAAMVLLSPNEDG
jgi:hypothetical protein